MGHFVIKEDPLIFLKCVDFSQWITILFIIIIIILQFYEGLVRGEVPATKETLPSKPLNKITKFLDSDSSESEDDTHEIDGSNTQDQAPEGIVDKKEGEENRPNGTAANDDTHEDEEPPAKKICLEPCQEKFLSTSGNAKVLSIDKQIEAELEELSDRNKVKLPLVS